jgi:3-methyladenine DNA glycosylase AlkD
MKQLSLVKKELNSLGSPAKAKSSAWFFKTGKGEYGEGDMFLGVSVPEQRKIAKRHINLPLSDVQSLLKSKVHEYRFTALEMLVFKFEAVGEKDKERIFRFYLKNSHLVNNWDLVDTSAPYIVGAYLLHRPRHVLYAYAKSKNLWQRRISIVATLAFIRDNLFSETLAISELLLADPHGLIQKAVGWMLREVGKRDEKVLKDFLEKNHASMPRTALRYAIERFPEKIRKQYLLK